MATHEVYILPSAEKRLALLAERLECSVEYLIERAAEDYARQSFRSGNNGDPARQYATEQPK